MPVMDVNRGYGDYGNGNWLWIIVIFALLGWGRNGEQCVTPTQMQNGFDTAEILGKLDRLDNVMTNGLCDGFYTTNMNMANNFASTRDAIGQVRFDTQVQTGEINKGICELKFDNARQTQTILEAINKNKVEEMQNRINQLELQSALCGVIRYPNATTYSIGAPMMFNQGCGCCA